MGTLITKHWLHVLLVLITSFICWKFYIFGQNNIQTKWDAAKIAYQQKLDKVKSEQDVLNRQHSYEVGLLTSRLETARTTYEENLSSIDSHYTGRLQQSEKRASVYKRQAEAGTTECRSLASHAVQLDSSLEQGRQLVEELRATVRFRDSQLIELGNQIKADRKLLQ